MTLLKTTAVALVFAAAPMAAHACEWMSQKTATVASPVAIGSATVPNATPVDPSALTVPVIEVEATDADTIDTETVDAPSPAAE